MYKIKIAASKLVRDLHHSFSSDGHKLNVIIVSFLFLLLFFHLSVSKFFGPLDHGLNSISTFWLVTGAVEREVFVDLSIWSLH
jgi:hypothetical protein